MGNANEEALFTAAILTHDNKNYHAWSHRQWVIKQFNLWNNELEVAENFIQFDVRNNSAWNHRWFVLTRGSSTLLFSKQVLDDEMEFAMKYAMIALHNECPFNYMRGIAKLVIGSTASTTTRNNTTTTIHLGLKHFPQVIEWALVASQTAPESCVALQSFCCDILEQTGKYVEALQFVQKLGQRTDTIRQGYWMWRSERLNVLMSSNSII
jgi:protein farnesyltransferase/geranylgeranyltransferase type-1 subunit alpha